ncbi:hypothetical protein OKW22_001337 [Bacilli bacterium PM5-3]|nr:hypothetical protein [Bacilli bacterium PM5-3]MDH6604009.1 hypothetical protein [Bacilli bacterium PM5-9]
MNKVFNKIVFCLLLFFTAIISYTEIYASNDISNFTKVTDIRLEKSGSSQDLIWNGTTYDLVLDLAISVDNSTINSNNYAKLVHNFSPVFLNYTGTYEIKHNNITKIGVIKITATDISIEFYTAINDLMLSEITAVVKTGQRVQPIGTIAITTPNYAEHALVVGNEKNAAIKSKNFKFTKHVITEYDNFLRSIYKGGKDSTNSNKINWTIAWNMDYGMSLTVDDGQNYLDTQKPKNQLIKDPLPEGSIFFEDDFTITYGRLQYVEDGKRYYASSNDNGYDVTDIFTRIYHNGLDDEDAFIAKLMTYNQVYGIWIDPITSQETLYVFMKDYGITTNDLVKRAGYSNLDDYISKSDIPEQHKESFKIDHTYDGQGYRVDINFTSLHSGVAENTTVVNKGYRYYSYPSPTLFFNDTHTSALSFSGAISKGTPYSATIVNYDLYDSLIALNNSEFELYKRNGANWDYLDIKTTNSQGIIYIQNLLPGDYKLVHKSAKLGYDKSTTIYKLNGTEISEFSVISGELEGRVIYSFTKKSPFMITTSAIKGTITPPTPINQGENKTIAYSPNDGYEVKSIIVDGNSVDKQTYKNSYSFTNVSSNHSINVEFKKKKFNIDTHVDNGTITKKSTIEYGNNKTVKYLPNIGYQIKSIIVDGNYVDKKTFEKSYVFSNIKSHHSISVKYEKKFYTIKTSSLNGEITSSTNVEHGKNKKIYFKPNDGYSTGSIVVNEKEIKFDKNVSFYLFENVTSNMTIHVGFNKTKIDNLVIKKRSNSEVSKENDKKQKKEVKKKSNKKTFFSTLKTTELEMDDVYDFYKVNNIFAISLALLAITIIPFIVVMIIVKKLRDAKKSVEEIYVRKSG